MLNNHFAFHTFICAVLSLPLLSSCSGKDSDNAVPNTMSSGAHEKSASSSESNSNTINLNSPDAAANDTKKAIFRPHMWIAEESYKTGECLKDIANSPIPVSTIGFTPNPIPGKILMTVHIGGKQPDWIEANEETRNEMEDLALRLGQSLDADFSFEGSSVVANITMYNEKAKLTMFYDKNADSIKFTSIRCVDKCAKTDLEYTSIGENIRNGKGVTYRYCQKLT